jgi:hypothetical protein
MPGMRALGCSPMRRLLALPLALAGVAAAPAATPAADAPAPSPVVPPVQPAGRAVDWRLSQAGHAPRSLDVVAFGSSSCLRGQVSATAELQATRIVVSVVTTSVAEICTSDYAAVPLTVQLPAAVRGRAIVGPRRLLRSPAVGAPAPGPPGSGRLRVPRVTDLSRRDAVQAVRDRGLRARVLRVADLRGMQRVVGQRPASGRVVADGATVSLYLSR